MYRDFYKDLVIIAAGLVVIACLIVLSILTVVH